MVEGLQDSLGSERKQRIHAKELLGDNMTAQEAVFSFLLKSGGEELRAAPFVYVPDLMYIPVFIGTTIDLQSQPPDLA